MSFCKKLQCHLCLHRTRVLYLSGKFKRVDVTDMAPVEENFVEGEAHPLVEKEETGMEEEELESEGHFSYRSW